MVQANNAKSKGQPAENQQQKDSGLEWKPLKSRHRSRQAARSAALSVVNTVNCGKRLSFHENVVEFLGASDTVQMAVCQDGIVVSNNLVGIEGRYTLRKSGKKFNVYCSALVEEITSLFELDFSQRTSISFEDVEYRETKIGTGTVARFNLRQASKLDTLSAIEEQTT